MVGAADGGLEVGNEGVDPFEDLQVTGSARADDDGPVRTHHRSGSSQACQAVGDQVNRLVQRRARPARQRRALQIGDRVEAHMLRMALRVDSTAAMKGTLFVDPRPGLPARTPPR